MYEAVRLTGTLDRYQSLAHGRMTVPRTEAPQKVAADKSVEEVVIKCDNHPDRVGKTFTGGGAYEIHLCEYCTPTWLKD